MSEPHFDRWRKLLTDDGIEQVLDELKAQYQANEVILALVGRVSALKREEAAGTASRDDLIKTRNQLRLSTLEIIAQLEKASEVGSKPNKNEPKEQRENSAMSQEKQIVQSIENVMKVKKTFPNSFIPVQHDKGYLTLEYLSALKKECEQIVKNLNEEAWDWEDDQDEAIRHVSRLETWFDDLNGVFESIENKNLLLYDLSKGVAGTIQKVLEDLVNPDLKPFTRAFRMASKSAELVARLREICKELEKMIEIAKDFPKN